MSRRKLEPWQERQRALMLGLPMPEEPAIIVECINPLEADDAKWHERWMAAGRTLYETNPKLFRRVMDSLRYDVGLPREKDNN